MGDLDAWVVVALVAAAFLAGLIDSIAGGGGLITLPALLLAGVAPIDALGTNKVQSVFGSGSATIAYGRAGQVDLRAMAPLAVVSAGGSALGAATANVIPEGTLSVLIPIALVTVAVYFLVRPDPGELQRPRRITPLMFACTLVPLVGFYDGVFGPGTGSFFMIAYVALAGYGLLRATGHTKVLNFASNAGALIVFSVTGTMLWGVGLLMGAAQVAGATTGSHLALRHGGRLIRPLLVVTCLAMALRLLVD
ncbi:MAG: TSUP family transporter [Actinomycetota bacterium]